MMTTDRRNDTISRWLQGEAPAQLPDRVLDATFERTRAIRQQGRWRARLEIIRIPRPALALGGAAVAVAALMVASTTSFVAPVGGGLPTTPAAWSRIVVDGQAGGAVVALAASPRGALAAVGEGPESRLYFTADGTSWTRVAADQHPPVGTNGAALVADDRRFLLVGSEVFASDDGLDWRRIGGAEDDPDLRAGTPIAAAAAGPGFVAVGSDNVAWYSTDGTDWTLAQVPQRPGEPAVLERPLDPSASQGLVEMQGIAEADGNLIAWGISTWVHDDSSATFVPVLWASSDGRTWDAVPAPSWSYPKVAGGPNGFAVASEDGSVWLSSNGRSWERVEDAFGPSRWAGGRNDDGIEVEMWLPAIAASPDGYVAAGSDGICLLPCPSEEVVVWTSSDGRTWTRLPSDERFAGAPESERGGAGAEGPIVRWGSRFVVGGHYEGAPATWVSGAIEPAGGGDADPGAILVEAPTTEASSTPDPVGVEFAGRWVATDPPPEGSNLTMDVVETSGGTFAVTIRDDYASVCAGATSTMTGVAAAAEPGTFVIEQPDYVCDDGSTAQALSGPPLEEQLRDYSFSFDSLRGDTMLDSFGLEWTRAAAAP